LLIFNTIPSQKLGRKSVYSGYKFDQQNRFLTIFLSSKPGIARAGEPENVHASSQPHEYDIVANMWWRVHRFTSWQAYDGEWTNLVCCV